MAIRIPAEVVKELGLKEGDAVELRSLDDGEFAIVSEQQRRREALARLRSMRWELPADYKFDREKANAR